ncbi:hypothetical protein BHE74_00042644 [Ensete ventricosum]|nr:hypothetical protein BHE74_00042644 [Ensete ventricosum]
MGVGGAGEGGGEDERAGTGGREVRVLALKVDDGEAWCREQPSSVSALTEEEKESSARLQKEVKLSLYSESFKSISRIKRMRRSVQFQSRREVSIQLKVLLSGMQVNYWFTLDKQLDRRLLEL